MEVFHDLSPCIYFAGELQDLRELGYCNMLSQVLFIDDRPCEGQGKLQLGFFITAIAGAVAGAPVGWRAWGNRITHFAFKGRNNLFCPREIPRQGKTCCKFKDEAKCSLAGLQSKKPSLIEPLGLFEMLGSYFIAAKANFTTWSATSTYSCIVHGCRGVWVS